MSTDKSVTQDLIKTLEDGQKGFADAADKLADTDRADLADKFREFSGQRARMSEELQAMAATYGDETDEKGTVAAAAHRGWMAIKDALSGSDANGVLDAAEQGEDHAVSEYKKALEQDISGNLRVVVQRQMEQVTDTHNQVRLLRDASAG